MPFPETRPRRLRRTPALRKLIRETTLAADNFIYPLFVGPGKGVRREIPSMPGQFHFSVDTLAAEVEEVAKLGIPGVILFGLPYVHASNLQPFIPPNTGTWGHYGWSGVLAAELESELLGTENIVWLNAEWIEWQDEHSPMMRRYTFEEAMSMVLTDLNKEGDDEGPLVSLPRATLVSFTRIMGGLLLNSQMFKSGSGTPGGSDTSSTNEHATNAVSESSGVEPN